MMAKKVIVIGAGPVGALAALYAAKRGNVVEVYELRGDLRKKETTPLNFTKSINLALSERGINALRLAEHEGLLKQILSQTIPMYGRMVHIRSPTGSLVQQSQAYDVHGRFQRSIDRGGLNATLLDELEKLPNVTLHFQHKLTGADFNKKKAWIEVQGKWSRESTDPRPLEIEVDFDLMLGCDGAHSAVRFHMMKFARVNYTQEYIDCLWCEFEIQPSAQGTFKISPNHLHIWPAGSCMFIALPNLDKSFVCTLFGPVALFDQLRKCSKQEFVRTFDRLFPGVVPQLITEEDLSAQFERNPHLPLLNIKCNPHHYKGSVAILGDAANAVVPFYGQGMNAGLESVRVLFEHFDEHGDDWSSALSKYTAYRTPDTYAIANLALDNYVEMRSSVVSPLYKLRKFVEEKLDRFVPSLGWSTQYARVSFTNTRYSTVIEQAAHQKAILQGIFTSFCAVIPCAAFYIGFEFWRRGRWIANR